MLCFPCPTKEKTVTLYVPQISLSDIGGNGDNVNKRLECLDRDGQCTYDKCPVQQGKIKMERGG